MRGMIMVMPMGVTMIMSACFGIGSGFRCEGRFVAQKDRSQPFDHRLDHAIGAEADRTGIEDLYRQMPVSQMPGKPGRGCRCSGLRVHDRFRRFLDADMTAIVEQQPVTLSQYHGLGQVQQERHARIVGQLDPPSVAPIQIQRCGGDAIRVRPVPRHLSFDCPPHIG